MGWNEFLTALSKKNKAMASVLKEWRFLGLDGMTLTLVKGGNAFSATYLDDPERWQKLIHYCREFFESPITLVIKDDLSKDLPAPEEAKGEDASSSNELYGELPQPVQQVLNVFDGAIKKENSPPDVVADDGESARKKGGSEG